jgi:hypothetical protein
MKALREYWIEACWIILLVVIFLLTPAPSSAQAFDWLDLAFDCSSVSGWCVSSGPIDIGFEHVRSLQ